MKTKEILSKYFALTTVLKPSMILVEKALEEYEEAYHEEKTRWISVAETKPEFGEPVFKLSKIILEDGIESWCEGEHHMP